MAHSGGCAFAIYIYTEELDTRMSATPKTNRKAHPKPITAEVRQFMHFNREGDVIPHGWNKKIGAWHDATKRSKDESKAWVKDKKRVWRSRPFAERLLARIVWFYTPSPIKDNSGKVTGWRRKFRGPFWQLNTTEMAEALGCSARTIRAEIDLLKTLGLITTKPARDRTHADGTKKLPIFVVPVYNAIVGLTQAEEDSSLAAEEDSSLEPRKNLPISSFLPPSLSSSTSSTVVEVAAEASPNENPTVHLQEEREVKNTQVPPPAATPARAPAPPNPQREALDQRLVSGGRPKEKLINWDISVDGLESARKGNFREDKTAIEKACNVLAETISEIVNDYQWRFWRDRKQALEIIKLDLHLDDVVAYVRADCDSIAQKQKERDGYGMGDALQAVRIALAAQSAEQKKPQGPIAMYAPDGRPVMIERHEVDLALAQGYKHV